jgi:hypothetical protein
MTDHIIAGADRETEARARAPFPQHTNRKHFAQTARAAKVGPQFRKVINDKAKSDE